MRVLAVAGGILALLLGSLLSVGLGLVALLGFGATAVLWRARGAPLTRRATLIGAVLAVTGFSGGFFAWTIATTPGGFSDAMQQSAEQASREPPPPIVRSMRRFTPPPDPNAQRAIDSLFRSKAFVGWFMGMTVVMMTLFLGVLVGTPAWGCAMLIGYGLRGRWPMAPPQAA